jgi:hypothetical protein
MVFAILSNTAGHNSDKPASLPLKYSRDMGMRACYPLISWAHSANSKIQAPPIGASVDIYKRKQNAV